MPILTAPHEDFPNVLMMGKLDLVMFDETTHKVVIWDIKTSTRGWTKWDKENTLKTSQMVIYKRFFAEQYNVPVDNIDVKYFIVKRKIPDNPKYAIMKSRIQKFVPSSGKLSQNRMIKNIRAFIEDCFIKERKIIPVHYSAFSAFCICVSCILFCIWIITFVCGCKYTSNYNGKCFRSCQISCSFPSISILGHN